MDFIDFWTPFSTARHRKSCRSIYLCHSLSHLSLRLSCRHVCCHRWRRSAAQRRVRQWRHTQKDPCRIWTASSRYQSPISRSRVKVSSTKSMALPISCSLWVTTVMTVNPDRSQVYTYIVEIKAQWNLFPQLLLPDWSMDNGLSLILII